jgi:hypothetical protein
VARRVSQALHPLRPGQKTDRVICLHWPIELTTIASALNMHITTAEASCRFLAKLHQDQRLKRLLRTKNSLPMLEGNFAAKPSAQVSSQTNW